MEEIEYITKTDAKETYFLTDKDLEDLEYKTAGCTYSRRIQSKLYKLDDIRRVFMEKNNISPEESISEVQEQLQTKKDEKRLKRRNKAQAKTDVRKAELELVLEKYGVELREDSRLCQGYIDGTLKDWTLDQIAKRMCQMKFLFEYCDIDSAFAEAEEDRRIQRECGDRLRESLLDAAESIVLRKIKHYPKVFPWQIEKKETSEGQ